jgi:hypothetical protein
VDLSSPVRAPSVAGLLIGEAFWTGRDDTDLQQDFLTIPYCALAVDR